MRSRFIFALACTLVTGSAAFAQNWLNPAGGSWGNTTNWSGNALPGAPTFNLNSATGYTVTLPTSYFVGPFIVQTDITTISLNGHGLNSTDLEVGTQAGQNASLTLLGPGTFTSTGGGSGGLGSGTVNVGGAGTGLLTINGATLLQNGNQPAAFSVNGLVVENGGKVDLATTGSFSVTNGTFNDGTFQVPTGLNLSLNNVMLTNNSSVSSFDLSVGNATIDNSGVGSSTSTSVGGTVTVSDHGGIGGPAMTVSGTIDVLATGSALSGQLIMQNGTLSVELNALVSNPISRPFSVNNGALDFTLQSGFTPTIGEQFHIFNSAAQTGTFATVNVPALPVGESWDTSALYTTGVITVVPEPMSVGLLIFGIAGLSLRRRAN
jgi:hypothetical protein